MNYPNIRFYALFVETTGKGKKTPKYAISEAAGYYPPMDKLKGKDGKVSMYYKDSNDRCNNVKEGINIPAKYLQAKDSLNFTGLKDLFTADGKLSGFAYGNPLAKATYTKDDKPNPFFAYKNDGFIFKIKAKADAIGVETFELLVLENAKPLIAAYCKMLQQGGFDDDLQLLREQAKPL